MVKVQLQQALSADFLDILVIFFHFKRDFSTDQKNLRMMYRMIRQLYTGWFK